MQVRQIGILALGGASIALGFGVVANLCIDMMWPSARASVPPAQIQLASASSTPVRLDPAPVQAAKPMPTAAAPAPAAPAPSVVGSSDIRPTRVKTIPMVLANIEPAIQQNQSAMAYAEPTPPPATKAPVIAATPKPKPAPVKAAKPAASDDDHLVLSNGQIDRIKTALALTPDQEGYWPAIAEELRAIAKQQPKRTAAKGAPPPKLHVDDESVQRLYSAAAPLIMRLREDQKQTVRQLALMLGLQEVAQAL
jgi:hypothetical protein